MESSALFRNDSWNFPGAGNQVQLLSADDRESPFSADDLKLLEELKQRTPYEQQTDLVGTDHEQALESEGVHCTVNAPAYKAGFAAGGAMYNIIADSVERRHTEMSMGAASFEQQAQLGDFSGFTVSEAKQFLAVLGVSLETDIDSNKSANSEYDTPDTPTPLSLPNTPHSDTFAACNIAFPQQQALAAGLTQLPSTQLPSTSMPFELPQDFLMGPQQVAEMRREIYNRSQSSPLPLDRAWRVTQLLDQQHLHLFPHEVQERMYSAPIVQQAPVSLPLRRHVSASGRSLNGRAVGSRTPPRVPSTKKSPPPESPISSEKPVSVAGSGQSQELSVTDRDSDDSVSGDVPRAKRRKASKRPQCSECSTHHTPQWRHGPGGPRSLCNACGVRYQKMKKLGQGPSFGKLGDVSAAVLLNE